VSTGPYICGDQFTAADVYVGSQIGWGLQFGTIEKRPAFEAYSARLRQREAAVRASQLDDVDMAKVTPPQMAAPQQPAA
jgi:glutathione S-transferase